MSSSKPPFVLVDGLRFPPVFSEESVRSAQDYRPRDDDLFVVTYPKCGTTWTQVALALVFAHGEQQEAKRLFHASPFLELKGAKAAETMSRPGIIKTHLPFQRAPWSDKAKYILLARNPKDCCVSYYHHHLVHDFSGGFDDFFELFLAGKVNFGDYFTHLMDWYDHRNKPNVLFMTYEEMKQDLKEAILKMASFIDDVKYAEPLKKNPEKMGNVFKFCSLDHIKEIINHPHPDQKMGTKHANVACGLRPKSLDDHLVRKGVTGDWKNYFSEEQSKRMDDKFAERTKGSNLVDVWKSYL